MRLTQIVEALLFASDAPLTAADLARADERLDEDTVTAVIEALREEYDRSERAFQVFEVAGGFQMLTRPDFASVLERYQSVPQASRLSMPALEVLAILAYRQPLGRLEIEEIRGVQSSAVLRTLQDRGLIEPVGRAEGLGRPVLYGTTAKFLEHFGFRSLEDLPRPDDLPVILRARPIAETPAPPAPFATAEPTPLSPDAEAEAEALHLPVHPARDHPADADGLESADPHAGSEAADEPAEPADEPTGAAVPEEVPDAATGNGVLAEAAGETPESGEPDANEVLAAADPSEQDADDAPDGEEAGAAYLRD